MHVLCPVARAVGFVHSVAIGGRAVAARRSCERVQCPVDAMALAGSLRPRGNLLHDVLRAAAAPACSSAHA
jgi:hypothetical protein